MSAESCAFSQEARCPVACAREINPTVQLTSIRFSPHLSVAPSVFVNADATPVSPRAVALDGPTGYDPRLFIDEIDKEFICSLCKCVMRNAVVISNDPWYVHRAATQPG